MTIDDGKNFAILAIGASAGGLDSMMELLRPELRLSVPVVIAQHLPSGSDQSFADVLASALKRKVLVVYDKMPLAGETIYLAPSGYHTLIDFDQTFALDAGERVNYSKPSIDVLFESVAEVFGSRAVGVILSGANKDGADGLKSIQSHGGAVFAQDSASATVATMPQLAAEACALEGESVGTPAELRHRLRALLGDPRRSRSESEARQ